MDLYSAVFSLVVIVISKHIPVNSLYYYIVMTKEKIALLTYKAEPLLTDSEQLLVPAFTEIGIEATATPWDDDLDWTQFSTIIVRACWNYHLNKDKFINWLEDRAVSGIKIWNPIDVIKWNIDKHYLLSLEKSGIKIIPSVFLEPNDMPNISEIMIAQNWYTAVIKPAVGTSAFGVRKFNQETMANVEKQLDRTQSWILQQFCPEINSEGEYSLIFFDGEYSHAVMKKPNDNDFRTQPHYGGSEWVINPAKRIIDQAKLVLSDVKTRLLYARVDGLVLNGDFYLMELELVEPYLFLDSHPQAPQKFVNAYKKLSK